MRGFDVGDRVTVINDKSTPRGLKLYASLEIPLKIERVSSSGRYLVETPFFSTHWWVSYNQIDSCIIEIFNDSIEGGD